MDEAGETGPQETRRVGHSWLWRPELPMVSTSPPECWVSRSPSSVQFLALLPFAPHSFTPIDPRSQEETPPLPCGFLAPIGLWVCKANLRALPISQLLTALAIFFNDSYPLLT